MSLFGDNKYKRKINVAVFADEQKNIANCWNYSFCLIIPTLKFDEVVQRIQNHRATVGYTHELKFSEIKHNSEKFDLAQLWLKELIEENDIYYFKVFGINTQILKSEKFGEGSIRKGQNYSTLYNRFFRTNLLSLKYFFSNYDEIHLDGVFHDTEGNLEANKYFDWHSIKQVSKEEKIIVRPDLNVKFVHSNHKIEKEHPKVSEVIQLTDVLLGTITHCIHQVSKSKVKDELADLIYPLLHRLIKEPNNKNSKYNYYRKYDIGFFPKVVPPEVSELDQYIHRDIPILYGNKYQNNKDKITGQTRLF